MLNAQEKKPTLMTLIFMDSSGRAGLFDAV